MVCTLGYELDLACIPDGCLSFQEEAGGARHNLELFGVVHVEVHGRVEE
jgi:hypothetical protein